MERDMNEPFLRAGRSNGDRRTLVFRDVTFEKLRQDDVTVTFPKQRLCSCAKVAVIALYVLFGVAFICFGTLSGVDKSYHDVPLYIFIAAYVVMGALLTSCLLASAFTSSELRLTRHDLTYRVQGSCREQSLSLARCDIRDVRYVDSVSRLGWSGRRSVRRVGVLMVVMDDGAVHDLMANQREDEAKWVADLILQEMEEFRQVL